MEQNIGLNVKKTYTIKEISVILGISLTSTYQLVHKEAPFPVMHLGKCIRVPKKAFDEWFAQFS